MINKSFKLWIILFVIINLLLLIWSLGYFKFLEEKNVVQDNVIVIEPDNQFKKSLPPDDESFPNEKSKVWGAFQDRKNSEQIMQRNAEEEKNNKIENDKKIKSVLENKENKSIDDEQLDIKSSKTNEILETTKSLEKKKLKDDKKNNNNLIQNNSKKNENFNEQNVDKNLIFYVQVASLSKKDLVEKEWNRFKKKYSKYITEDLIYISQKAELNDNRVFFRLLVGKFMSKGEANDFCDKLSIKCIVKKNNE